MFQPPYLPEIHIWLGQNILDSSSLERKMKFATQTDEMALRDSREMDYGSKLQNMKDSATHMWTRCPDKHDHIVVL